MHAGMSGGWLGQTAVVGECVRAGMGGGCIDRRGSCGRSTRRTTHNSASANPSLASPSPNKNIHLGHPPAYPPTHPSTHPSIHPSIHTHTHTRMLRTLLQHLIKPRAVVRAQRMPPAVAAVVTSLPRPPRRRRSRPRPRCCRRRRCGRPRTPPKGRGRRCGTAHPSSVAVDGRVCEGTYVC